MIRIGLVDLDTSHPQAFTAILKSMPGVDVVAVCDHHDVWPEGYDRHFASENGVAEICNSPDEMVPLVDAALVHSVNWDTHIKRTLPFLRAGKPVLIDKPVVGSMRDCLRLEELRAQYGDIIFGGSSLRFAGEVTALKEQLKGTGSVVSVSANGPGDFFSYGIHTTEMAQAVLGVGATNVEYIHGGRSSVIAVEYGDGPLLILQLELPAQHWTLSVQTASRGMLMAQVDSTKLYPPFLRAFVDFLEGRGRHDTIMAAIEAVKIHLAADLSRRTGKRVSLKELPLEAAFDGAAFAATYAAGKRTSR